MSELIALPSRVAEVKISHISRVDDRRRCRRQRHWVRHGRRGRRTLFHAPSSAPNFNDFTRFVGCEPARGNRGKVVEAKTS